MTDTSIMSCDENTTPEERTQKQYQKAVSNGFQGTKEEYLLMRDFT